MGSTTSRPVAFSQQSMLNSVGSAIQQSSNSRSDAGGSARRSTLESRHGDRGLTAQEHALFEAVKGNDLTAVREMLQAGVSSLIQDQVALSLLDYACILEHSSLVGPLLDAIEEEINNDSTYSGQSQGPWSEAFAIKSPPLVLSGHAASAPPTPLLTHTSTLNRSTTASNSTTSIYSQGLETVTTTSSTNLFVSTQQQRTSLTPDRSSSSIPYLHLAPPLLTTSFSQPLSSSPNTSKMLPWTIANSATPPASESSICKLARSATPSTSLPSHELHDPFRQTALTAYLNQARYKHWTALTLAACCGAYDICRILLDRAPIDLETLGGCGYSALNCAIKCAVRAEKTLSAHGTTFSAPNYSLSSLLRSEMPNLSTEFTSHATPPPFAIQLPQQSALVKHSMTLRSHSRQIERGGLGVNRRENDASEHAQDSEEVEDGQGEKDYVRWSSSSDSIRLGQGEYEHGSLDGPIDTWDQNDSFLKIASPPIGSQHSKAPSSHILETVSLVPDPKEPHVREKHDNMEPSEVLTARKVLNKAWETVTLLVERGARVRIASKFLPLSEAGCKAIQKGFEQRALPIKNMFIRMVTSGWTTGGDEGLRNSNLEDLEGQHMNDASDEGKAPGFLNKEHEDSVMCDEVENVPTGQGSLNGQLHRCVSWSVVERVQKVDITHFPLGLLEVIADYGLVPSLDDVDFSTGDLDGFPHFVDSGTRSSSGKGEGGGLTIRTVIERKAARRQIGYDDDRDTPAALKAARPCNPTCTCHCHCRFCSDP